MLLKVLVYKWKIFYYLSFYLNVKLVKKNCGKDQKYILY
jgi:hypothetical protein